MPLMSEGSDHKPDISSTPSSDRREIARCLETSSTYEYLIPLISFILKSTNVKLLSTCLMFRGDVCWSESEPTSSIALLKHRKNTCTRLLLSISLKNVISYMACCSSVMMWLITNVSTKWHHTKSISKGLVGATTWKPPFCIRCWCGRCSN